MLIITPDLVVSFAIAGGLGLFDLSSCPQATRERNNTDEKSTCFILIVYDLKIQRTIKLSLVT